MLKSELLKKCEEMASELNAIKEALNNRFYTLPCRSLSRCVAVPLTRPEWYAIQSVIENEVSNQHGNGKLLRGEMNDGTFEIVLDTRETLLPQFAGYVVHYHYDDNSGTYISDSNVWGMLELKK